jgi:hypothetical protein
MRLLFITGFLLLSLIGGVAQVSVELVMDQEQYLRDESLPVRVRITNRSGRTLTLGREVDWLTFAVENRDGHNVRRIAEPAVKEEFTVESSMVATRRVDIASCFDLGLPGMYRIVAQVKIPEWNQELLSAGKSFEVVRGAPLWEQLVGVPGTSGAPEVRRYVLQQANVKRLTLYARVTDENDQKTFKVFPVGPMVSFSRPEAQVDRESNLHLLFQTGARSFSYSMITPQGDVTLRQRHDYAGSRPVLRATDDGRILVAGGQRMFANDDLPPPLSANSTNNVSAVRP